MKLQRVVVLILVLSLAVGGEIALMNVLTNRDSAEAPPVASPTAQADAAGVSTPQTATPEPTRPGYTSPPASNGGSSSYNDSASSNSSSDQSSATEPPSNNNSSAGTAATDAPVTAPPTEPPASGVGSILASNSFSSNTGVGLNLNVSWQATDLGGGRARINVSGSVSSYDLDVMALPVTISFAGYSTTVTGSSISVGSGMSTNPLFSTSFDVDAGAAGDMTVSWNFGGTYSDTDLPQVVATGYVYTS